MLTCTCRDQSPPYTNLATTGGYDGRWWVHDACGLPTMPWLKSLGDDMLNLFLDGPRDGKAYATSTLIEEQSLMEGYHWTPEVKTSPTTGASARVWRFGPRPDRQEEPPPPPREPSLSPDREDQPKKEKDTMAEATTTNELKDLRTAAKISRKQLSDVSGLTQAKIARIETGSSRNTEEEIAAFTKGVESLKAKQPAPAAAAEESSDPA